MVPILDTLEPPIYQRIADKAAHLQELRLSNVVVARQLGVSDKTVAKAVGWMQEPGRRDDANWERSEMVQRAASAS